MLNKILLALCFLAAQTAFASSITVDAIYGPPAGIAIHNGSATLSLPTAQVDEAILTQSNAASVTNKSFDNSSNAGLVQTSIYDFAVNGGSSAAPILLGWLPAKAIIKNVWFDVITQPVGVGASLAFGASAVNNLYTAHVVGSYAIGQYQGVPNNTVGNAIKLANAGSVAVTISGADLTAGKIAVFVQYLLSK